jgi:hypothetical protein
MAWVACPGRWAAGPGNRWCSQRPCDCRGSRGVLPPAAGAPGPRIKLHECRDHAA